MKFKSTDLRIRPQGVFGVSSLISGCEIRGDSNVALLSKKIKTNKKDKIFFINKYYKPDPPLNLTKYLLKFANSSIDISDGLFDDLSKTALAITSKYPSKIFPETLFPVQLCKTPDDQK